MELGDIYRTGVESGANLAKKKGWGEVIVFLPSSSVEVWYHLDRITVKWCSKYYIGCPIIINVYFCVNVVTLTHPIFQM